MASMTRRRSQRTQPIASTVETFRFEGLVIFAVALGVRLLHLWLMRGSPFFDVLMGDARGYDTWATELAQGDWIGREVFYQAPLYPYFMAVLYAVFGHDLTIVRVCQTVLGALSSVALGVAGWRLFSARIGLIAGLILALYPTAIFFDGLIQKSSLDGFFTCVALALLGRIVAGAASPGTSEASSGTSSSGTSKEVPYVPQHVRRGARWPWLALGAAMGAMALTRENALLLIVVLMVWAVTTGARRPSYVGHPFRGAMVRTAMFALGLALVLAPVAIRNYAVGGGFNLTTSQFGPNFFIGNNANADGTYMSLRFGRGAPEFERRDATEIAEQAMGRRLTPADVSSYWTDRALAFISAEPGRWLGLTLRKAALLVNRTEMLDTESQESHAEWSWPLAALSWIGHFGVLVPLAVAGMILSWPRRSTLWVLYALTIAYAASVVVFFVFARYRYPLVPLLILFASAAIARFRPSRGGSDRLRHIGSHRDPARQHSLAVREANRSGESAEAGRTKADPPLPTRTKRALLLSTVLVAVVCNWPMLSSSTMKAITETNLALALQESGSVDRAVDHYRRAIQFDAEYAPAYSNLGTALRAQGKPADAVAEYERALARLPDNADVLINLGNARVSAGDLPGAIEAFKRAVAADPGSRDARQSLARAFYDLGSLLLEQSAFMDAEARLRDAISADPSMADAHNNLGIALASQGRMNAAIVEFRRALEIRPGFVDAERNLGMALGAVKQ
jgi:Tfp pilus assembly protein PilF